tara:strand:- start:245 stop:1012 length:768 start_codon:yes stop_codon:yes gene_type:complete
MKVSIITLTSNSIKTIKKTINSIHNQDYKNIQKIWIDNCSNDGTFEYLKSKKDNQTVLISKKDKGIFFGLNKGLKLAKGDIVGVLHSDDFFNSKNIISNIVDKFKNNNINLVYGDLDYIFKDNKIIRKWIADKDYKKIKNFQYFSKKLKNGWMPPHPTAYFSRKFINLIGNYNTTFRISSDYDFLVRALINKKISAVYIPKTLIKMKIGGNSNKSLKNIFFKMVEDYKIIKKNRLDGFITLILKNLQKIKQLQIY